MMLIADGGSTKTDWCLVTREDELFEFRTEGYNPYFADSGFIKSSLLKNLPSSVLRDNIASVYFYGAGCFEDKAPIVEDALRDIFPAAIISVQLDLLGAGRALLAEEAGFVSILGTGTNTCLYDGLKITMNIDSLGYILGDEGSGCYIGKKLLGDFVRGYMPSGLYHAFLEKYHTSKEEIFNQVYSKPFPNRYCAGFSPFLLEYETIAPEYAKNLVKSAFRDLFENLIIHYPGYKDYSFNCVGSIGYYFRASLEETAESFGMQPGRILKTPMEGLVGYHTPK